MSIIQGNAKKSTVSGFYSFPIEQSLRFNDDDSAYLSYVASSGSRTKFTISCWTKLSVGSTFTIFGGGDYDPDGAFRFFVSSSGRLNIEDYDTPAGAYNIRWSMPSTGPLLRDPSAWYHIVLSVDTTPATPEINIYVNGEDWGSYWTKTNNPSQNDTFHVNIDGKNHYLGYSSLGTLYADGYLAEVNFIDGTALTADSFGELKNGVWIPKDPSGLTYGTNGFRLSFADDAEVEAFNTVLYRGNGATQSVTGMGFQPDLVWIKERTSVSANTLFDSVRGPDLRLFSDNTNAESSALGTQLNSFDSDGFTTGGSGGTNENGQTYVAWGWKAGGTPTVDNSAGAGNVPTAGSVKIDGVNSTSALAGTIPATRLSANPTYGFSIVSYTGNGSNNSTVGHGLGAVPAWVITKARDNGTDNWAVFHSGLTSVQHYLQLNTTGASASGNDRFGTNEPTSSVMNLGYAGSTNTNGRSYIMYCWAEKAGYSKFDSYSGATGEITVYTTDDGTSSGTNPFKPAFVLLKRTDSDPGDAYWVIFDNTRDVEGDNGRHIIANLSGGESDSSSRKITFNDNGFTIPASASADASVNAGSGSTYIYAAFADTREAAFWLDQSGNDNDWQPVNLDHNDTVADSPTDNFATLNPLAKGPNNVLSEGNLQVVHGGTGGWQQCQSTFAFPESGKWYCEFTIVYQGDATDRVGINVSKVGYGPINTSTNLSGGNNANIWTYFAHTGSFYHNGSSSGSASTFGTGDVIQVSFDSDTGSLYFGKNGVWQNSGDPVAGTGYAYTGLSDVAVGTEGYSNAKVLANFGQQPFKYDPPAQEIDMAYLPLSTANLPDPVIDPAQGSSPADYFGIDTYTGNGGTIDSDFGFDCDLVWYKNRSRANTFHYLFDQVRGDDLPLYSNDTFAEDSQFPTYHTQSFITGGSRIVRTLGDHLNFSGDSYVAWAWKAGTSFSNDASATSIGTVDSNGSVSTESGFSIVRFNSGASGTQSFKHGLTQRPDLCIFKEKDSGGSGDHWVVWEGVYLNPAQSYGYLNLINAFGNDASQWSNTAPTDSIFTYNSGYSFSTSQEMIAYCFHSVEGFSKFGSYTGNGDPDGTFVYTGFRPAWVMVKCSSTIGHWWLYDTARGTYNEINIGLVPSATNADTPGYPLDVLSNGFKWRTSNGDFNGSGRTYIYMAFAENPFKYSNAR